LGVGRGLGSSAGFRGATLKRARLKTLHGGKCH